MTRPTLKLAGKPAAPSLALVKKALRLFRGKGIPKSVRHTNARKWLAANQSLGERHLLRSRVDAKWGEPGVPVKVAQIHSPRRLGGA